MAHLLLETIYKETIIGSSALSERERNDQNAQQKMNWQNNCQRLMEIGIMSGDVRTRWQLATRKIFSLLYLGIGVEECQIYNSKKPLIMVDILSTAGFWTIVEKAFNGPET